MNILGVVTLLIAMIGALSAIPLGLIMVAMLVNRRWLSALRCFAALVAINIVTVGAAELGVGQWNKAIAARVAQERKNSN
jgi:hypothetical protein